MSLGLVSEPQQSPCCMIKEKGPFGVCGLRSYRERCGNLNHEKIQYGRSRALALMIIPAIYFTYVTARSDLSTFCCVFPARWLHSFEDCQAPKRSSLDMQLSARTKGGFSYIFIFPLVCFCLFFSPVPSGDVSN